MTDAVPDLRMPAVVEAGWSSAARRKSSDEQKMQNEQLHRPEWLIGAGLSG